MANELTGCQLAILVTDGFEQSELEIPKKAIEDAGATAHLISPNQHQVKSWKNKDWGEEFDVDISLEHANAADYLGLVLPGGVMNPDKLRIIPQAITFIEAFINDNKPIAAICHGSWPLIDANGVKGQTLTSWPSLKFDLINAGATWVNKEVVRDNRLVTSRKPDDLPAFCLEMLNMFSEFSK